MNRKFLGFTVSRNGAKLKVADKELHDPVRDHSDYFTGWTEWG